MLVSIKKFAATLAKSILLKLVVWYQCKNRFILSVFKCRFFLEKRVNNDDHSKTAFLPLNFTPGGLVP